MPVPLIGDPNEARLVLLNWDTAQQTSATTAGPRSKSAGI
jgi:hypothetical protein